MFNENKKTAKRVCMKNKVKKDVNLYRIEQLEPRLMMDATVSDWTAESNLIDDNLLPAQYVSSTRELRQNYRN